MKARRHAAILDVIARGPVRSQEQLRRSMRAAGFDASAGSQLRAVPAASVVATGAFGSQTSLFLRGGDPDYVKVLIDGVPVNIAKEAMTLAAAKLSIRTRVVTRMGEE